MVNFTAILCKEPTDKNITKQEVIYVIYVDLPDTNLPVMNFFEIATPENSQDAPGLKEAIILAFSRHGLDSAIKTVFLSSDRASVNCGSNSWLTRLFQEDHPWLAFVLCFSHRLKLSLKDALLEFVEPVDTSLTHLFYIYSNSSKKHWELKSLYQELKRYYEMYVSSVTPLKGGGTIWINHKLQAMGRLLGKFGLYMEHFKDSMSLAKNSATRATVQGKLKKLVDAKVLLCFAFLTGVLAEGKKFSLLTQEKNVNS